MCTRTPCCVKYSENSSVTNSRPWSATSIWGNRRASPRPPGRPSARPPGTSLRRGSPPPAARCPSRG
eukprot:5355509-Lingulodinium_polyedra.AAC.1